MLLFCGNWTDMEKLVAFGKGTADEGLCFVPLQLEHLEIVVLTDAAFANTEGLKSQLGFVVLLAEANGSSSSRRCNIVDFGSSRASRVTRSVLAAELFGLVLGFDRAFVVREMVDASMAMICRYLPITEVTDGQTAFNCIARLSNMLERRLQIDIYALQESLILWHIEPESSESDSLISDPVSD